MSKKEPKAEPKAKGNAGEEADASSELSEDQLERVAGGASDIFAKIGDIKGESTDDKHKDQIEILSINAVKLPKRFF